MTKSQIAVFEKLLQEEGFKGKKQLRHILWLNTTKPKHKIGDCFEVSDAGHMIYGFPVKNFKAKITNIMSFKDEEEYRYELEIVAECRGGATTAKVYKYEHELVKRCKDNKNALGDPKSEVTESLDV